MDRPMWAETISQKAWESPPYCTHIHIYTNDFDDVIGKKHVSWKLNSKDPLIPSIEKSDVYKSQTFQWRGMYKKLCGQLSKLKAKCASLFCQTGKRMRLYVPMHNRSKKQD
jgi:hypothetical protein